MCLLRPLGLQWPEYDSLVKCDQVPDPIAAGKAVKVFRQPRYKKTCQIDDKLNCTYAAPNSRVQKHTEQ